MKPPARPPATPLLWCWRHPRAMDAAGRCIGRTDIAVDRRKARRLAHRMRALARREGLAREVWVSPLARSRDVGWQLARWGWRVHVDERLAEMDFGRWDGRPWTEIAWAEVEDWQQDLLNHAPGEGESLTQLAARVRAFVSDTTASGAPRLVVGHGGWLNALLQLPRLLPPAQALAACDWPAPPGHGARVVWPLPQAPGRPLR